jgi:serine/threonine protein kinase HipA of HipAB toxin-antitoxin module
MISIARSSVTGAACGLSAPEAELLDVAGLSVLAVKRYDRRDREAGGIPVRVHQEDGCQATGTPPGLKYEEQGGPAPRDLAPPPPKQHCPARTLSPRFLG